MKTRSLLLGFLIILIVFFSRPTIGFAKAGQDQPNQVGTQPLLCITTPPSIASFPNVTFNFKMLDANLVPISPDQTQLRFIENNQPAVPVTTLQQAATGAGINYYIIVDKGNRSPKKSAHVVLQTIASYINEQTDKVQIYTNDNNVPSLYYPGPIANNVADAATKFSENSSSLPGQITSTLDLVLSKLKGNTDLCKNMSVIIMVMGDDTLFKDEPALRGQTIKQVNAKLVVFHLPSSADGAYNSRDLYTTLATTADGIYQQVLSPTNDIKPVLDKLGLYHQVNTVTYRTNSGQAGAHTIAATYQNANIVVQGQSGYAVQVNPPTVVLQGAAVVKRSAQSKTEAGDYTYDIDSLPYVVNITWGDSFPREIKSASLVVKEGDTENEIPSPLTSKDTTKTAYEIIWNFSTIKPSGDHTLYLSVKVTDEFGYQATSAPLPITLTNNIATSQVLTITKAPPELMYGLYALLGLVVVLVILMIFMWRRMFALAKQGGTALKSIAGEIRKTLVGGGKKGKPLATLKVLDGPPNMIGHELKIYTESVRLGRNPQLADMTFYGPDVITSVSGLHARIEKYSGVWRIVALSQSGSETFVDDQPIPFNEPVLLQNGQKIRMGYFAQQPVIFEFVLDPASIKQPIDQSEDDPRKTDVKVNINETDEDEAFYGKTDKNKTIQSRKESSDEGDSFFDEYRDR